ncbi:hypothetical protein D3C77_719430 [compost metagenome]
MLQSAEPQDRHNTGIQNQRKDRQIQSNQPYRLDCSPSILIIYLIEAVLLVIRPDEGLDDPHTEQTLL